MSEPNTARSGESAGQEPGWPQIARASLLAGFGGVEVAAWQTSAGFSRVMLGSLFILTTGAILGVGALLWLGPLGAGEAEALDAALRLLIVSYLVAVVAAAAGFWSGECQGLAAMGLRNREIELLNRAQPGVASPSCHELEARLWSGYADMQTRRASWTFFVSWGLAALGFALTIWAVLQAAEIAQSAQKMRQAAAAEPAPALMERIARLEALLELHPPRGAAPPETDPKLLERIELLERQLELNPTPASETPE